MVLQNILNQMNHNATMVDELESTIDLLTSTAATEDDTLKKQQLLSMGTRPLGDVIFQDPSLLRTEIEVAEFSEQHQLGSLINELGLEPQMLWGRRSVFSLSRAHFLVAEVFLPGAYIYL